MFRVRKIDEDRQIVTGEVYAPNQVDLHGELMLPEDVELIAHRFMQLAALSSKIDKMHSNDPAPAYPVESFIARPNDPDYIEGAWVLSVKVEDATLWQEIKDGKLNGFSWEAYITKKAAIAEIEFDPTKISETEITNDHSHLFVALLDDDGKVVSGRTSTVNNHSHAIKKATATEETEGHSHRFFI